jgi:hypothetical protein
MRSAEGMPTSAQRALNLGRRTAIVEGSRLRNRKETNKHSGTRPFTEMDYPSGTTETSGQLTVLQRRIADGGGEDTFITLSSEENIVRL